nr:MAG TPA: hypothetical protein [Caudoviricetes sp.]
MDTRYCCCGFPDPYRLVWLGVALVSCSLDLGV